MVIFAVTDTLLSSCSLKCRSNKNVQNKTLRNPFKYIGLCSEFLRGANVGKYACSVIPTNNIKVFLGESRRLFWELDISAKALASVIWFPVVSVKTENKHIIGLALLVQASADQASFHRDLEIQRKVTQVIYFALI